MLLWIMNLGFAASEPTSGGPFPFYLRQGNEQAGGLSCL